MAATGWATFLATFVMATLGSSCCWIQVVLNALSLPCAGFAVLDPYNPYLTAFTVLLLGGSLINRRLTPGRAFYGVFIISVLALPHVLTSAWFVQLRAQLSGTVATVPPIAPTTTVTTVTTALPTLEAMLKVLGVGCSGCFDVSTQVVLGLGVCDAISDASHSTAKKVATFNLTLSPQKLGTFAAENVLLLQPTNNWNVTPAAGTNCLDRFHLTAEVTKGEPLPWNEASVAIMAQEPVLATTDTPTDRIRYTLRLHREAIEKALARKYEQDATAVGKSYTAKWTICPSPTA